MAPYRRDPVAEIARVRQELDQAFDRVFSRARGAFPMGWTPAADVAREVDSLVVSIDLPGVDKDDLKVEVADDRLTISGCRRKEREETRRGYYTRERSFGSFTRTFSLPRGADADQIGAEFADGVLRITMPYQSEEPSPRVVEVTSAT
jgi:HSP20 family protein